MIVINGPELIMDTKSIAIIFSIIGLSILVTAYYILKFRRKQGQTKVENFRSLQKSQIISPLKQGGQQVVPKAEDSGADRGISALRPESDKPHAAITPVRDHATLTANLQALAEKYSLSEITLATEDGLVIASSAERDVQADAARYSQMLKQKSAPDEPGVMLFELDLYGSHLVGITRTRNELRQNLKPGIDEDTKGILQLWL